MEAETEQRDVGIKQKIINTIKIKGPVIPVQISREIGSDILMASAHLSELASEGKLKISNVKVGGTPLYYLSGQESSLQNFSNNLPEKENRAFDLLKEKKVLRDNRIEPVVRVALRAIKDFAVPLQTTYQDNKEIFWKWYLLDKEEASFLIKKILIGKEEVNPDPEIKKEEPVKKAEERKEPEKAIEEREEPVKKEIKQETIEKSIEAADTTSSFSGEVKSYFKANKIEIKNEKVIRKNSEIDFILEIPSTIGVVEFYCKAKNKKRVNDLDLSSAYVHGQLKKLPVLFLTSGELTKKAKEMLTTEFKLKIKKI